MHVLFPPISEEMDFWLVYLTWTTSSLAIHLWIPIAPHTRVRPTTLIISLNDVNGSEDPGVRQDETEQKVLSDHVGEVSAGGA